LTRSQSRRTLESVGDTVTVLLGAHRSRSTFARWHSTVPTVARGSLEVSVEAQVDGMPHDDGLRIRRHHHTRPFLSEFSPSTTR
jgi:hypothetical protein